MDVRFDQRLNRLIFLIAATVCLCTTALCAADEPATSQIEFFEKRVRPILVEHCYECHGADDPSGKLRLDTKAGWKRGGEGGPAIVPGDPSASLLIRAVSHDDAKLKMPPPDAGGKLTDQQIADLETWIRRGAVDPRNDKPIETDIEARGKTHWAFRPVRAPVLKGGAHPVDELIDRKLTERGFVATGPADMRTLIRRATLDLHGLPPTAKQLATSREEFPELIQRLLSSPRYGERWGRHWLDVARYSDAKDGVLMYGDARIRPFAYTYRDYVIRAFNDDKPFDQFIREQIAADQMGLADDSPALAGMGLLTLGRMFDRNRHDVIDDQIDVVTRGFLGLTVSCSRCHDHKFDPVPTADYYSLYGVFASSMEPYDRPRIEEVSESGKAFEKEFGDKLAEVFALRQQHYGNTLETARRRTPDYLMKVATTEPDISETAIFFLSLLPNQLRPQITWRWRKLIDRRAFAEDPIFGPWHDMMLDPVLKPDEWRQRGVDPRIVDGLLAAKPMTPEDIARTYGEIIRSVWEEKQSIAKEIGSLSAERATLDGGAINLADVVGGGNGFGSGTRGHGIHPVTGKPTTGETGFIPIERFDELIAVPSNPFIDGIFTPKSGSATATSTGVKIDGFRPSEGKTWDYFKYGPSSGSTTNSINGVDYGVAPNWMLALHANKGVTFDVQAMRSAFEFRTSRFQALLGHGGAKGESQLDVAVYLDGHQVVNAANFPAQGEGLPIDVAIGADVRFLTLLVTEGGQGISHDQAILGNPRIVPDKSQTPNESRKKRIAELERRRTELQLRLDNTAWEDDQIGALLMSRESPVWFPIENIYYLLSRKEKDSFRGTVNQLDAIAVKHSGASARAMIVRDSEVLYDPVIFQRGNPGSRGNPVPRQFLRVVSEEHRKPFSNGSGRLDHANAIASPHNPLTARVWVNRVWMHHFGEPLVENPSDFGLRTPQPVHHELLDFLAAFLIENGWRTKPLHELIMTSAAWQRRSRLPESERMKSQLQVDPDNRLVWHANRRRIDLEQMRDTLLFVSGTLDETMFGPPKLITDTNNRRRTVYAFVERQNLPNIIQTFDFANADTSTPRRTITTVPQQALFAMNSSFMTEAANRLASRTSGENTARVRQLYEWTLGRAPGEDELALATSFLSESNLEQLAQVLLMSNELMFVD